MTVRRIWRVYYDLPNYIVPKEVKKAFRHMDNRKNYFHRIETAFRDSTKESIRNELKVFDADLELLMDVITPKKCTWGIAKHATSEETFWVMTIFEYVNDSIFTKGQDDDYS